MDRLSRLPHLGFIGVPSTLGVPAGGAEHGPAALRALGIQAAPVRAGLTAQWRTMIAPLAGPTWPALIDLCQRLASETAAATTEGEIAIVLGGDHAMAVGTWRGVARALGEAPGLLWIDAHLDAHTRQSSASGNPHGMPLAALLGASVDGLELIDGPLLDPSRVALVGANSWEPDELSRLQALGVRIFPMQEVRQRGLALVMRDALAIAQGGGKPFGTSLDLDAIDPAQAPGVATPVADGLDGQELRQALHGLLRHPQFIALEIAEYDPGRDVAQRTGRLAVDLLEAMCLPPPSGLVAWEDRYGAHNYLPLPVVLARGAGSWAWDVEGRRYLDLMGAYSALSFGHGHPRLVAALQAQASRLAVTSRAYYNDRLPLLLKRLSDMFGYERVLPVNTGLEAVETALKAARKWAHKVKGVPEGQAEIIACAGNFHGRSIAITGLSTEAQYRSGFGPYPPGLTTIPFGDAKALEAAITPNTAAFLVEPIQCEGGIIVPPVGYLAACAEICRHRRILLIADEVQTGLGRTGRLLACEHEQVRPDGVILGKALGGGLLPVSAFLADDHVMQVFTPGDHGSTFGGNPLGAAVALEALALLEDEGLVARAAKLGDHMQSRLAALQQSRLTVTGNASIRAVRGRGLLAGIELDPAVEGARSFCERLLRHGVLSKDTHHTVVRLAPPLTITREELDHGLDAVQAAIDELAP